MGFKAIEVNLSVRFRAFIISTPAKFQDDSDILPCSHTSRPIHIFNQNDHSDTCWREFPGKQLDVVTASLMTEKCVFENRLRNAYSK